MKNDTLINDLAEAGTGLYPHLKITGEKFPRILATRHIEDDGAEYFGAFLTKTAVRILIDFLNRTFRLRSCDIPIDGTFSIPCTQYFRKRCLAPCVESICGHATYLEMVDLARLFLANRRSRLTSALTSRIAAASDAFEFEEAAHWRDILLAVEKWWKDPRLDIWLDDTIDTYDADETIAGSFVYLVTQRGRTVLGRKVFKMPKGGGVSFDEALEDIISSFYRFHLPSEIRVSMDFEGRTRLTADLTRRFDRPARIVLTRPDRQRITAIRALQNTWSENELEFLKAKSTPRQISGELKRLFALDHLPQRVEAFDVAHISGKNFVAASTVWQAGEFLPAEYEFYASTATTETSAIGDAVRRRLEQSDRPEPDLILIDGGRSQLNAALSAVKHLIDRYAALTGAVKPRGKHSSLSHFITEAGDTLAYEPDNPAQNVLRLLRDAAHDLANRVHRDLRDMGHHYELAAALPSLTVFERNRVIAAAGSLRKVLDMPADQVRQLFGDALAARILNDVETSLSRPATTAMPLIVPIRFNAENGDAGDLIPIRSSKQ